MNSRYVCIATPLLTFFMLDPILHESRMPVMPEDAKRPAPFANALLGSCREILPGRARRTAPQGEATGANADALGKRRRRLHRPFLISALSLGSPAGLVYLAAREYPTPPHGDDRHGANAHGGPTEVATMGSDGMQITIPGTSRVFLSYTDGVARAGFRGMGMWRVCYGRSKAP